MLTSTYSNLSLSCLSLIFGPGLLETWWFVEMSPGRTKNILQYDNGIMPAAVKMCHINYTLSVTTCIVCWYDSPHSTAKHLDVSLIMHFHDPRAPVRSPIKAQVWALIINHIYSSYLFIEERIGLRITKWQCKKHEIIHSKNVIDIVGVFYQAVYRILIHDHNFTIMWWTYWLQQCIKFWRLLIT